MSHHQDCHVTPIEKALDAEALRRAHIATLAVAGMGCERCATRVRNGLLEIDGVIRADVDLDAHRAVVAFDPERAGLYTLLAAVVAAGDDGRHAYRAQLLGLASERQGEPEAAP